MAPATSPPVIDQSPCFVTCWYCPFVQRVWLALGAKGVELKECEIDLANKPDWFLQASPVGKVPVVSYVEKGKTHVLYESVVLVDWVNDYFKGTGPSLMPEGATGRALARIMMSRFDPVTGLWYKLLASGSKEDAHAAADGLRKELAWFEANLSSEGPLALGSDFSAVDCVISPLFIRSHLLKHYRGFDMLAGFPRLQAYKDALLQHPAVKASLKPPAGKDDWFEALIPMYGGRAYGKVPVDYFN